MTRRGYHSARQPGPSPIYERATAIEVARLAGLQPNRQGFIRCPVHADDSPSCHLLESGYHCFGCGARGGLLDLCVALGVARDRSEAARWIEGRIGHE